MTIGWRSVGHHQLVFVIVVVVVVPTASPVLLLWMLRTDIDATRLFVIALRLLLAIVGRFSGCSTGTTATATTVLIVDVLMMGIMMVVVIVVVVVVRAKVAILLLLLLLRVVIACLRGIVVTRTEYRRRMFELVSVGIGTTVSPVLLRWNRHRAGSYGRSSTFLLDHIQRFLLLLGLY